MNTQKTNLAKTNRRDIEARKQAAEAACNEMAMIFADSLLDQHVQNLQGNISLLQTMENALDLISENLARVRQLAWKKKTCSADHTTIVAVNDEIRNLLMVNMLIAEDTELDGHYLFRDDIIRMNGGDNNGELTLTTTRIPEIAGIETNDLQATLDSLDNAARTVNRQYKRVSSLMAMLLKYYQQLLSEVNLLLSTQTKL